ncbi:hypothetical protein M9Y10_017085 [Tritrichomonas musculus]|uniref:HNH nuclease domain-containing protein n=1 Tax=Tritrichomonas musculus TaxID=1915356 RepID=A0ABR2HV18_9EUKA
MTEQAAEFVQLKGYDDYEILSVYPFTIRRKDNHYEVKESKDKDGYLRVSLNCKTYFKHRLIARQFIPNDDPEHKTQIDHKNKIRDDNHIQNIRWCSSSENNLNKSIHNGIQYEFVDDIPNEATMIDYYETKQGRREFEEHKYYYYHDDESNEDIFYCRITENLYKTLHINQDKTGKKYINIRDIENKNARIFINRFKFQRNLIE